MAMYVNYTVSLGEGSDEFQVGPYSIEEADIHKRDIAGYWGVTNVYLTPHRDESRKRVGGGDDGPAVTPNCGGRIKDGSG